MFVCFFFLSFLCYRESFFEEKKNSKDGNELKQISARQQAQPKKNLLFPFGRRHENAVNVLFVLFEENFHHDNVAGRESLAGDFFTSINCLYW